MRSCRYLLLLVAAIVASVSASLASASPAAPGPGWEMTTTAFPTNISPGGHGILEIDVVNVGAAASNGKVTVTDVLPPGLIATDSGDLEQLGNESVGQRK